MKDQREHPNFTDRIPPSLEEVKACFRFMNIPDSEAEAFYFYYQGLDWRNESGSLLWNWVMAAIRQRGDHPSSVGKCKSLRGVKSYSSSLFWRVIN